MLIIELYSLKQQRISNRSIKTNFKGGILQKPNKSTITAFSAISAAISAFFATKLENYYTKPDKDGRTKIHYYCSQGNFARAKFAINHCPNIDINKRDNCGLSYIDCVLTLPANYPGADGMCNFIASKPKYNPNSSNEHGDTDAYNMISKHPHIVWNIMSRQDFDVNKKGSLGYITQTAINAAEHEYDRHLYTKPGDYHCLRRAPFYKSLTNHLISDGRYDPNSVDNDGNTDIHTLIIHLGSDAKKTIEKILRIHPTFDINLQNNNGKTCIDIAKEKKLDDIIQLLNNFVDKTGVFSPII